MKPRRCDCVKWAAPLGLTATEIMRDLTPGELADLLEMRYGKEK